jgi:hypothetical protein
MRTFIVLILSSFFLAIHCKKNNQPPPDNPYGLPNATQTGANTFGCRVNGTNYVLEKLGGQYIRTSFLKSNNRDTLTFSVKGKPDNIFDLIGFTINSKIQQGATYRFNDTTKAIATTLKSFASCGVEVVLDIPQLSKAVDGFINISKFSGTYSIPPCCSRGDLDANAIIAGTFNFIIAIPGCDTIKVTDGRFDINYSNY